MKYEVDENGCHRFIGYHNKNGYGVTFQKGKTRLAHKRAWEDAKGRVPDGLEVCHRCDVRDCINVEHLFLGTHADNMADMAGKGRAGKLIGEDNHKTKLTKADVYLIRSGSYNVSQLSRMLGVSRTAVRLVRDGKNWAHA